LQYLYARQFYDLRREPKTIGPRCFAALGVGMAIQDYVRSIAATDTVSKSDVFRYLEMQFSRADKNHDGLLTAEEVEAFTQSITWPEADQR
jgi:hypothetical protein